MQQRKKPQFPHSQSQPSSNPLRRPNNPLQKKVAKNEWNNTWKTTKSTQLRKSIQDFHQQTPNFNNRKEGIIITRLRTGHTKLTHEHKIKKTTPLACTHCNNRPLTIIHILHECHTTEIQGQKYGINANINLTSRNNIQRVLKYLKNINYYARRR